MRQAWPYAADCSNEYPLAGDCVAKLKNSAAEKFRGAPVETGFPRSDAL